MKYGLIIPEIKTEEEGFNHFLGSSRLKGEVINSSGGWKDYLPVGELQNKGLFEPNACVSFGTNHAIQTLYKFFIGKDVNYSDRALAIDSGTDPNQGNDPHTVAEDARTKLGFAPESVLPFDDKIKTLQQFYSPNPLTQNIIDEGNKFFNEYNFRHGWVFRGGDANWKKLKLKEALTMGTVCVSVYAWVEQDGKYIKPMGATDNHWVELVGYDESDCPVIFDSYAEADNTPYLKTLDPLYDFEIAKYYYFIQQLDLTIYQKIINLLAQIIGLQAVFVAEIVKKNSTTMVRPIEEKIEPKYLWSTPKEARHSFRVICDELGLSISEKNLLTAVLECESGFRINAIHENDNGTIDLGSEKLGVAMLNSYWYIDKMKLLTRDEALNDPEKSVRIFIDRYKKGFLKDWICYRDGSYKKYLKVV